MTLDPTTLMGIRAAVATITAVLLTHVLTLVASGITAALGDLAGSNGALRPAVIPTCGEPDWVSADIVRLGPVAAVLDELSRLLTEGGPTGGQTPSPDP